MGVADGDIDHLELISGDPVFNAVVAADLAKAYDPLPAHHQELFVLGVMPMVPLGDPRFGNINGYLPTIGSFDEFGEGAAFVDIHLQRIAKSVGRKITQVGAVKFFCEVVSKVGDATRFPGLFERVDQLDEITEFDGMNRLHLAEVILLRQCAVEGCDERIHHIVDVHQIHAHGRVVDLDRQAVGDIVAEGRHARVVVGTAPLAEDVGQAVDKHRSAGRVTVSEHSFFSHFLAGAVRVVEGGLSRGGDQQRRLPAAANKPRADPLS